MRLLHDDQALIARAAAFGDRLRASGLRLATAESCTGGLIAAVCTSVPGSSDWFEHGVVSYSNAAKHTFLGVDAGLITTHGAVSEPVALAMARGALGHARAADLSVAVTGIAGPGGGTPGKPVGLVWLAVGWRDHRGDQHAQAAQRVLPGDRSGVRSATVQWAFERLDLLESMLAGSQA
jgi:nicotinamide-nucleotide amidase